MQASYSRIDCFKQCPYKFKLHYIDDIETIPDQDPANALNVGSALHKGIETDIETAIKEYLSHYYVITDQIVNEIIKLEMLIPKIKEFLSGVNIMAHEYEINTPRFKGFVDLITNNDNGTIDVFDFKYSNNIENYLQSGQLHIYKYFLEQQGFKVNKIGFIFIPKISIRQKQDEDIYQFRKRLRETLEASQIQPVEVQYNPNKVIEFFDNICAILDSPEYIKNQSKLCDWCQFKEYCMKGYDYMILPTNQRRERKIDINPDMWIYADSYVGKSTFVDQFDDLLFLNTDGNTDNTTSPVIRIADEVTVEGRMTKRKMAWDVFLDVIAELEKKQNDFKRVCIDLVEDLYEHCRLYVYNKLGIEHEQDAGYGKGWDMVRTEFLSAIKRLKNLGYQIIYISKEVVSEINLKNSSKLTTIKPNINDKVANVLAGTVDLTVRAYMDDENRYLLLEKRENIFGGGRFNFKVDKIPLNKEAFIKALQEAQEGVKTYSKMETSQENQKVEEQPENTTTINENKTIEENSNTDQEAPKRRRRKTE